MANYLLQADPSGACCDCPSRASPCDNCGCCNRDVTEISTCTITGDFAMQFVTFGNYACSFSKTWTRIPQADAFDGVTSQFKLYFDNNNPCQLFVLFNDPVTGHNLPVDDCSNSDSNDTLFGSTTMELFSINMATNEITLKFKVDSSEAALGDGCSVESSDIIVPFTTCDVSNLLGTHTISNHCDDVLFGFEFIFDVTGSMIFA